jgi:transcriptional regulator with XRE-family HTH domain
MEGELAKFKFRDAAESPEQEAAWGAEHELSERISRAEGEMRPHVGMKLLRKAKRLSQQQLADILGVSRKTYQLYETRKLPIPSVIIGKLAANYDVDIHELFTGRPFPSTPAVKMANAKVAIAAFRHLASEFLEMEMSLDEMERITLAYTRAHEPGDPLNELDLMTCVKIVTDDKYLPY